MVRRQAPRHARGLEPVETAATLHRSSPTCRAVPRGRAIGNAVRRQAATLHAESAIRRGQTAFCHRLDAWLARLRIRLAGSSVRRPPSRPAASFQSLEETPHFVVAAHEFEREAFVAVPEDQPQIEAGPHFIPPVFHNIGRWFSRGACLARLSPEIRPSKR